MMKKLTIEEKKWSKNVTELDSDNDSVVTVEDYFLTSILIDQKTHENRSTYDQSRGGDYCA